MSEKEVAECFGTIDKEVKESCRSCGNSGNCEEFKPILDSHTAAAKEKGREEYIEEVAEGRETAKNQFVGYGLAIAILLFVFFQVFKDI